VVALAVPVALTGCALTHPTDPHAPVRGGYRARVGPRPALSAGLAGGLDHPLTLAQCVELAQDNKAQIGQRYRDAEGADAQRDAAAAIRRAAPIRVRVILMTQLTTVLGLVPLALNLGEGGDMLKPMAVAVIAGLVNWLLLALLLLPGACVVVRRSRAPKTEQESGAQLDGQGGDNFRPTRRVR